MRIGIIGHGEDKFSEKGALDAKIYISQIIKEYHHQYSDLVVISGHSPVGGVDIWAETYANNIGVKTDIKSPHQCQWDAEYGYKQRNEDIANESDILFVILVDTYPLNYFGMKFNKCYHCNTDAHVKSGACWTAKLAKKMGKKIEYIIIKN